MENRGKFIENIKNVLIAVLFISAVLLLFFFWKGISLNDLERIADAIQENEAYKPELSELTRPGQIEVCFGSGMYTIISSDWQLSAHGIDLYSEAGNKSEDTGDDETSANTITDDGVYDYLKQLMAQYINQADIYQEEIEKSQYDEVMSYPAITAAFSFNIPFEDFLKNNGIEPPKGSSSVENITEISFSTVSSENLFIYDDDKKAYYRFVTEDEEYADRISAELTLLIDGIEGSNATAYYTIENLAGIKNDTLIPVYQKDVQKSISCSSEFTIDDAAEIREYEQMFFPSGLDFVRKITKNKGTLIYTYGYNQKVLLLGETGCIEYTEEIDSANYNEIGFYEGLEEVVEYVKSHGGWASMMSERTVPYLSQVYKVTSDDGKYKGFKYEFNIKLKGVPVSFTSGAMLSVEIYGHQVTSYQRDVINVSQKSNAETINVINAIDVITNEYEEIGNVLIEAAEKKDDADMAERYSTGNCFEAVTENIDIIRFCMMRDKEADAYSIKPAWYMKIDGVKFWCSPDDGHIITWNDGDDD